MNLKQELLTALRAGQGYAPLLETVRRHQAQGLGSEETYQILQQLWLELGFNNAEGDPLQATLEALMEKIWYECAA